jgi:DNA repair exonuclease SbcCD nuclease subunit
MPRAVVLHASDLHLDLPFEGVGRPPPHVAALLRDASLGAWDALVDLAIARDAAALLLAGGLCGGLEHGVRAQARLRDGMRRLSDRGIRVFIALGDRDPLNGIAAVPQCPPGVTVFAPGAPGAVVLERGGTSLATVYGASAPFAGGIAPVSGFVRGERPGPHLAVLHTRIVGYAADDGGCAASQLPELRAAGMDYWALGHAHAYEQVSAGAPWIVYSGTTQGRGLTPLECGAKGVVRIEIEDGAIAHVQSEAIDRVRCLRVEVADAADPNDLARLLTERADALRERHPGRALLLEAEIAGSAAVVRLLRQPDARAALFGALQQAAAAWEPCVWWSGIRPLPGSPAAAEETTPDGDDIPAEVLRRRAALAADAELRERFLARRFEPLREAWRADLDARESEELLDDAAAVAAAVLREDEA